MMIIGENVLRGTASISALAVMLLLTAPCQASITISTGATQFMDCSAGVCSPTADKAVLNVADLEKLLESGATTVTTTGSGGIQAGDIFVAAALTWTSTNALTLDANRSLVIEQPVSVDGVAGLNLVFNTGGKGGPLEFRKKGHIVFSNLGSQLTINTANYVLVGDIKTLAADIASNPGGNFALAQDYNATGDGTYNSAAVPTTFAGAFEALGNSISNFTINDTLGSGNIGLFAEVGTSGVISDLLLTYASITVTNGGKTAPNLHVPSTVGALVGTNQGLILNDNVGGNVDGPGGYKIHRGYHLHDGNLENSHGPVTIRARSASCVGGLIGYNTGNVLGSHADAAVSGEYAGGLIGFSRSLSRRADSISMSYATGSVIGSTAGGGLVGEFGPKGTIDSSYATGNLNGRYGDYGGLVGISSGTIRNSHATGSLTGVYVGGGLVGEQFGEGLITNSYATGSVTGMSGGGGALGGLVAANQGSIKVSFAMGNVTGGDALGGGLVGIMAGYNSKAVIEESFAMGNVMIGGTNALAGGLVGESYGSNGASAIKNSYATGAVQGGTGAGSSTGGLVGSNLAETFGATISASYSIGNVTGGPGSYIGGLIGTDTSATGSISATYWDTDTSGITNLSQGAGNIANDPGITGLTTAQFQSGLPTGFHPNVWAENSSINSGFPYLIANPPPQ